VFLGVEIGGTKIQLGVCDRRGNVRALERRSVQRRQGAAGILKQIETVASPMLRQVRAIGVGFGGPVDRVTGRVVKSHHVIGWSGFELRRWFARKFRLPSIIENDANCAAFAESRVGAGRGKRVVFYTNVGTGIGGGLVIDGVLYNGRLGAMELGHTVMPVCGTANWPSSPRPTGRRRGEPPRSTNNWVRLESLASGLAIERGVCEVTQAARNFGLALANAITLLNPDIVVVGGGITVAGEKFFKPLRQTVRRFVFPPFRGNARIVPAALGEAMVVVGAALLASRET
jgi:glucokinase